MFWLLLAYEEKAGGDGFERRSLKTDESSGGSNGDSNGSGVEHKDRNVSGCELGLESLPFTSTGRRTELAADEAVGND